MLTLVGLRLDRMSDEVVGQFGGELIHALGSHRALSGPTAPRVNVVPQRPQSFVAALTRIMIAKSIEAMFQTGRNRAINKLSPNGIQMSSTVR